MPVSSSLYLRPSHSLQWLQKTVASLCILALLTSGATAQTSTPEAPPQSSQAAPQASAALILPPEAPQPEYQPPLHESTRPYSILELWKPYMTHLLPEPVLKNSDRLHSLIRDGKLMLSLNDAVALVLENNFDIAIARY